MTVFIRLLDAQDKQAALREAFAGGGRVFDVDPVEFKLVKGSPFAYWISAEVRSAFRRLPQFEHAGRVGRQGGVTGNDFRWLRLWTEVPAKGATYTYAPFAKGGSFSPFYADLSLVVTWDSHRRSFWAFTGLPHRPSLQPSSCDYYFRPGLTWPLRTNGLSVRAMPRDAIFGHKGPAAFVEKDRPSSLLALAALMNSTAFDYLVGVQLARTELARSYEVGLIQQTPVPELEGEAARQLEQIGRRSWSLARRIDSVQEFSHAFLLPVRVQVRLLDFDALAIRRELAELRRQCDDIAAVLYGFESQRGEIERWIEECAASPAADVTSTPEADSDATLLKEDDGTDEPSLHSWAVGVAFGRFDIRLATGEREPPPEPEPFDPLPARSPGMLPDGDPPFRLTNGIYVDDPGHKDDLATVVKAVLTRVDQPTDDVERWLAREFFAFHVKMYSKSRRKAPIYWQLAVPSGRYSVWLYLHRMTKDTLYTVQKDYVAPKLRHEESRLTALRQEVGPNPTQRQQRELEAQETFVDELRAFHEEVARVAPLWRPVLDDGVIINFAPLWRLVPQHKAWQKECRATWDALCAGEYDWSHLAMHLWPERVVPKCADDRSLAIVHELEDVFWEEDDAGKWKARPEPTREVDDLARERTSAAVKAALKSLLEAPVAGGAKKKVARGKRARSGA